MNEPYLLLVEDRPKDELLIVRGLKKAGLPVPVVVARDGLQAVEQLFPGDGAEAASCLPLLVLMDIKLPWLSGLDVLQRIREHPATRCIPVVMLSSSDDARDLRQTCRLGANSYLRKSVSADRLNGALQALVTYWFEYHEQVPANEPSS